MRLPEIFLSDKASAFIRVHPRLKQLPETVAESPT